MQELGGQAAQADGSVLSGGAGEQNGKPLCDPVLTPMEDRMESHPLKLDAPNF